MSTLWAVLCSFVCSSKFGGSYKYYLLLQVPLFEKSEVSVIGHNLIGKRNQSKGQIVYENSKPKLCYCGNGKLKIRNYRFSDFKVLRNVLCIHCNAQIIITVNFIQRPWKDWKIVQSLYTLLIILL